MLRKTHVGRALDSEEISGVVFKGDTLQADDRAFFLKVRDIVEAAVSEATLRAAGEKLKATKGIRLASDPVKTVEVLAQRYALAEVERSGVLRGLIEGGELSGYGLVNALTGYSQQVEDYDRATELEMLGGRLVDLPAGEWRVLAPAA
jgi:hypothetical protein